MNVSRKTGIVLGVVIDVASMPQVLDTLLAWAGERASRSVVICNAHVAATAAGNERYCEIVNSADMATPDGAPVAWMMRRLGHSSQQRISGPDLMGALCERAEAERIKLFFYGGASATLEHLRDRLHQRFPTLEAAFESPPYRALSAAEDAATVERINASGAGIVFVGLGCPKQENWMAAHRGRVNAVMIGVGAAFDFHAGTVKRAPLWMRENGLEWLHRLGSEPRRLWKRYLVTNTLFVVRAATQLLRAKFYGGRQ